MTKPLTLAATMICAIASVGALAYWDARRESENTLRDFANEQASVARVLAMTLETQLTRESNPATLARALGESEPTHTLVLVQPPASDAWFAPDGRVLAVPALSSHSSALRLTRPEAAALGLPERMAMVGVAQAGEWRVAFVASAERVRDRQYRSEWRLGLSIAVAAVLVIVFGGFAARRQRAAWSLRHQLALTELQAQSAERLTRANRAATLGTLAMGIAHEIGTPLGIIAGRAEQLAQRPADADRVQKFSRSIVEQTEHISGVVRSFLNLARGDRPNAAAIAPAELVHGAVALVVHVFDKAGVTLTEDIASAPALFGDRQLLEHALVNLLLNACQACAHGGAVVTSVRAHDARVVFAVSDDGPGISEAAAQRVTEPFFTTKSAGNGLGLAIVNEVVKAHRGELAFAAREPHGTRASISLPMQASA